MKTKQTFLLRLRPTAHFFFGGENTFGYGAERNYLVRSRNYPQQTSLLGLLRFLLLQQAGLLDKAGPGRPLPAEAVELIGRFGFSPGNTNGYGAVRRLSPVFLLGDDGRQWLPAALNKGLRLRENTGAQSWLNHDSGSAWLLEQQDEEQRTWKPWSSKNELEETLACSDGHIRFHHRAEPEKRRTPWSEPVFFHPHEQVGIEKNFTGDTQDEAFYKQTSWRLRPDACFAFYAELETDQAGNVLPENDIVAFGGERSLFNLKTTLQTDTFDALTRFALPASALPADPHAKIVLLSDTWLPPDIYRDCAFAVTHTTPFRFHIAETGITQQYYNLQREPGSDDRRVLGRSERFSLLKRGSVLYAKKGDLKTLTDRLRAEKAFRDIGYNYFEEVQETPSN